SATGTQRCSSYWWVLLSPSHCRAQLPQTLRPPESQCGVALGGAVTIRCRGRHQNMRFLPYKVGNLNVLQDAAPAGDVAEFPIRNVSRGDAGSYSCRYSTKSNPPVWSEPSDPVELVVAGEGPGSASSLPAPLPAGPSGDLVLVGHSEPGSVLGPAEGTPGRGVGTGVTGGSPARGEMHRGVWAQGLPSRHHPPY
uniref:Immunoglobulin-like beta-sandwich domain-containing protein n=1 Tax=Chelydra serpentina TaxID=8475 RepID=A0A8C3SI24_CHESE